MELSQNAAEGKKSEEIENLKKAKVTEKLFSDHLNVQGIPYYYIDQSKESFSNFLKEKEISRPDYIVYTANGIFHVDVKYRAKQKIGPNDTSFYLNQKNIIKLNNFQTELHSFVWLAFTDNLEKPEFYYVSITQLYDYYKFISNEIEKYDIDIYNMAFNEQCPIHIPKLMLYYHLSFEKGFHNRPNMDYTENDVRNHIDKAITIAKINSYNNSYTYT